MPIDQTLSAAAAPDAATGAVAGGALVTPAAGVLAPAAVGAAAAGLVAAGAAVAAGLSLGLAALVALGCAAGAQPDSARSAASPRPSQRRPITWQPIPYLLPYLSSSRSSAIGSSRRSRNARTRSAGVAPR